MERAGGRLFIGDYPCIFRKVWTCLSMGTYSTTGGCPYDFRRTGAARVSETALLVEAVSLIVFTTSKYFLHRIEKDIFLFPRLQNEGARHFASLSG